jgi:hypothetical protein
MRLADLQHTPSSSVSVSIELPREARTQAIASIERYNAMDAIRIRRGLACGSTLRVGPVRRTGRTLASSLLPSR